VLAEANKIKLKRIFLHKNWQKKHSCSLSAKKHLPQSFVFFLMLLPIVLPINVIDFHLKRIQNSAIIQNQK
jgi:hypothetical protein